MPEQRVVGKVIINLRADKSIDCEFEGQIDHWDLSRMRPQLDQDFQLKYVHAIREDELARREENAKLAAKRKVEDQLAKDQLTVQRKAVALEKEAKRVIEEEERLGVEKEATLKANLEKEAKRRASMEMEGTLGTGLAMVHEVEAKIAAEKEAAGETEETDEETPESDEVVTDEDSETPDETPEETSEEVDTPEVPAESDNVVTETEETNEEG